ncbi:LysE family translocator [Solibacillus sp. FSL H8-0538]|uniref:LysE family translocator n=1 Tax=Solibacillus sp. FSL H8-0538 TaxID=2921400 RepID=UPI0030F9DB3E
MALYMAGFLLGMSLVLEIGTGNLALIRTGIIKGFVPALYYAIGSTVGDMTYAILSVVGIAALLQSNPFFQNILWIAGTIILLWLTVQSFRDAWKPKEMDLNSGVLKDRSNFKQFLTGIGLVLSSPTGLLWFATVGGSVVASTVGDSSMEAVTPFLLGFLTISVIWGFTLAYLSSVGGKFFGAKTMRVFSLLSGFLFLYFTGYVFIGGL